MNIISFMDTLPIWGVFLGSTIVIILSTELGFQLGKHAQGITLL